jgi:quinol monooxygenase YgiN
MVPQEGEDTVNLYEIYDDEAAFQAHLQTPHFAKFKSTVTEMILDQKIARLNVWENA